MADFWCEFLFRFRNIKVVKFFSFSFLSCLRGSLCHIRISSKHIKFLSCLRGSLYAVEFVSSLIAFLSCLRGSLYLTGLVRDLIYFLSCLRGSLSWVAGTNQGGLFSKLPARQLIFFNCFKSIIYFSKLPARQLIGKYF